MGPGGAIRQSRLLLAALGAAGALTASAAPASAQGSNVLLVCQSPGTGSCPSSAYRTVQAAVDAYNPAADWGVLIWPGDYHETGVANEPAGVWVDRSKAGIYIRGMDRTATIIDGAKPNANGPCSANPADQYKATSRNGIEVYQAPDTWIQNLTVCNFLGDGVDNQGNQIWWNGGAGSGQVDPSAYWGDYITGTSTYYNPNDPWVPSYGLFVSNYGDPGDQSWIRNSYASNMTDSALYIGGCQQACNTLVDHVLGENSAVGYSGTNSGGNLIIQNSEWTQNRSGIVPNSLNNPDAPPPQDGACPGTHTPCMQIQDNLVHDNNNANAPGGGIAGAAPVGTGIEISGGQFDSIHDNTVYGNDSWGIIVHDFPDTESPPPVASCQGGLPPNQPAPICYFVGQGNVVFDNALHDNGSFGNPTNGDLASQPAAPNPRNCFYGNTDTKGQLTSDPADIQTVDGQPCGAPGVGDPGPLSAELVCASGIFGPCPATPVDDYPQPTGTPALAPFATAESQPGMPNPCQGVPDDAWCSGGNPTVSIP